MNAELSEVQNSIVKNVALKEGFQKYHLLVTPGSMMGDGFMGIIISVIIKDDKKSLYLILKVAHVNEQLRIRAPVVQDYHREMFVYEEVFPAFRDFQMEYNILDGFSAYAKFYGCSKQEYNECLILENMKQHNYKLWDKKLPMNSEHLTSVIVEYGKLHAISLVMKARKAEVYTRLSEGLEKIFDYDSDKGIWQLMGKGIIKNGLRVVEGNSSAMESMQKLLVNAEHFYHDPIKVVEDRIVILHGDCWNNNLMFQYEDAKQTETPKKVCLLDWQMSRTGSPVLDLSYFLFVCSSKEDLAQFKKYLKIYHNTVTSMLRKFSCDTETIFPFALLESHWNRYAKFGALMAILLIKIMLREQEETPDLVKIAEGKNQSGTRNSDILHFNEYKGRILDIITVMSENKLI